MRIGLVGNLKFHINGSILSKEFSKSGSFIKKSHISTKQEPITKIAYLSKAFYHDKAMWLYMIKLDSAANEFYTLDRDYDFDVIAQPKSFDFYLRNADIKDIKLESIEKISASGVDIIGINSGKVFSVNEYKRITINALQVGDIELSAIINFRFSTGQIITLLLKGQRAVVFSYLPKYEYFESKEYKTDIFRAQNIKEKRVQVSTLPIRTVGFNITTKEIDSGVLEILTYAIKSYLMVPLWYSASIVKNTGTNDKIECDTVFREFKKDAFLIVWSDFKNYEFAKILSIEKNKITINKKILLKNGMVVLPLIKATPNTNIDYKFASSEVRSLSLEFKELL